MNFQSSSTLSQTRRPLILGLLATASALAGWMARHGLAGGGGMAGCGPAGGCSALLSSPYSRLWGLPVGVFGIILYFTAMGAVLFRAAFAARLAAVAILAGASWFVAVQALILKAWCPWCCLTHLLASAAAALILTGFRSQVLFSAKKQAWSSVLGFLFFGSLFSIAQIHDVHRTGAHTRSGSSVVIDNLLTVNEKDELVLFGGKLTVDPKTVPLLGQRGFLSPAQAVQNPLMGLMAPQPVILLTDWTCPHCRALLVNLMALKAPAPASSPAAGTPAVPASPVKSALESTTLVLLPAWREEEGRALHSLMLSAWLASKPAFLTLAGELESSRLSASPAALESRIQGLLGAAAWDAARKQTAAPVEEILKTGAAVLRESDARVTEGILPRLISANGLYSGVPSDTDLAAFLQSGGAALASEVQDIRKLAEPNKSRIEFESTAVETAETAAGASVTAEFRFTNTGTEPLNLVAIRTTCSCTVPEGWKQTVPPGGKGSFAVHIDTTGHQGRMSRQVHLVVNASNAPPGGSIPLRATVPIRSSSAAATNTTVSPPRRQVH